MKKYKQEIKFIVHMLLMGLVALVAAYFMK